jgi:hypothetical protein
MNFAIIIITGFFWGVFLAILLDTYTDSDRFMTGKMSFAQYLWPKMLSRENSSQDFEDEFRIGHYDYKYNDY